MRCEASSRFEMRHWASNACHTDNGKAADTLVMLGAKYANIGSRSQSSRGSDKQSCRPEKQWLRWREVVRHCLYTPATEIACQQNLEVMPGTST